LTSGFFPHSPLHLQRDKESPNLRGHILPGIRTDWLFDRNTCQIISSPHKSTMEDAERRSTKRSRFDQTEPEPRRSRFDRRSRSPPTRRSEARDRSPYRRDEDAEPKKPAVDAAAAAAEAAARINAQLQARKGIQHVDVPPIQSSSSTPSKPDTPSNADSSQGPSLQKEMYVANGDYIQDIEVNDLKNRYLITKASTQQMINDETGAGTQSSSH
jgi:hypothetical protein